jgi:hypothetical protein
MIQLEGALWLTSPTPLGACPARAAAPSAKERMSTLLGLEKLSRLACGT